MSDWVYIVAAIHIDTCILDKNIENIIENQLRNSPPITGSEGNANIFVNVLSGYNTYMSADCGHCEFGITIKHYKKSGINCKADKNYICPTGKYQTQAVITIAGNLRDRMKMQTEKEYNDFYEYITEKMGYIVRNKSVNIQGY